MTYSNWVKEMGIEIIKSSLNCLDTNRRVENSVKQAKHLQLNCKDVREAYKEALWAWNGAPEQMTWPPPQMSTSRA